MKPYYIILFVLLLAACAAKKKQSINWGYNDIDWGGKQNNFPDAIQDDVKNFVLVQSGTNVSRQPNGRDTFDVLIEEHRYTIGSFYMSQYEVTVEEYLMFMRETADSAYLPDSFCFDTDFPYKHCQPMHTSYFWHPARLHYPICGVSMVQAQRYCEWKTDKVNKLLAADTTSNKAVIFRLPTAAEWEYAAGSHVSTEGVKFDRKKYLNGVNTGTIKDAKNKVIKQELADGYEWQAPVNSFTPNDLGLYNMFGNVMEWTLSPLSDTAYIKISPAIYNDSSYYITKGGSFAHGEYYLQPSAFLPVKADEQHSWLGFRLVMEVRER